MSKKIKDLELGTLRKTFDGVKDFVILEPLKVDSATDFDFRKKLRDKKCRAQMVKNALCRKVFTENGIQVDSWSGPTILVWGTDSIKELSNAVDTLLKEIKKDPKAPDKFKIKTAVSDGLPVTFDLAKTLPTRMEAIGSVLSALLSAGGQVAGCLTGPGGQVAGLVLAIEEKKPAEGAEPAPAPETPAAPEAAPAG